MKYIRLYAPKHSQQMYPHTEGLTTNSSQIDLDAHFTAPREGVSATNGTDDAYPDFPGFGELPFLDCILQPGQMLYIPPQWWHYVKSCSTSFSTSFWWK